jgi:hypothetical protein
MSLGRAGSPRGEPAGSGRGGPGGLAALWGGRELAPTLERGLRAMARRGPICAPLGEPRGVGLLGQVGAAAATGRLRGGSLTVAWCGAARDGDRLREQILARGAVLRAEDDAELLLHLVAASRQSSLSSRVVDALYQMTGAFTTVVIGDDRLIAARDPVGLWGLWLGQRAGGWGLATDPGALLAMGLEVLREIEPGEVVIVGADGLSKARAWPAAQPRPCGLDRLRWARPDGPEVAQARVLAGRRLAEEQPALVDLVVPLTPDDDAAAEGFAAVLARPCVHGLIAEAGDWYALPAAVGGARVALVASGLTEVEPGIAALRRAGAAQVEVRWSVPSNPAPCPYRAAPSAAPPGPEADPRREEPGALSRAGLAAVLHGRGTVCAGCLDGQWPIIWASEPETVQLPLFGGDERSNALV